MVSEMFQIIVLMTVPAAMLLGLRRVVICQNRRLDARALPLRGAARGGTTANYGSDATGA